MKRFLAALLCGAWLCALLSGCGAVPGRMDTDEADTPSFLSGGIRAEATGSGREGTSSAAAPAPAGTDALTGLAIKGDAMRPVAVMVSNHGDAPMQWGVAKASVLVEALTEGKETNLCAWYSSLSETPKVGPVAQGKDVFWQLALPENAILAQKGMNAYAENLLNFYRCQPIDALYVGVNSYDYAKGLPEGTRVEFGWYTQGNTLRNSLAGYNMDEKGAPPALFRFGEPSGGAAGAAVVTVSYSANHTTTLKYDAASGQWLLWRDDERPLSDADSGAQAGVTNVILLHCETDVKDDRYTREYDLAAGGTGYYLTGDTWQAITWRKDTVMDRLKLYDVSGAELTVAGGSSYIGLYGVPAQAVDIAGADGTSLTVDDIPPPVIG